MKTPTEEVLEQARALLSYDPLTGLFMRTKNQSSNAQVGAVAGRLHHSGYVRIKLAGREYAAHRLAWLMTYGKWPDNSIDHLNRVRSDNRIANLRDATCRENCQNSNANTSGHTGVSWNKHRRRWVAQIHISGKRRFLGFFDDPASASTAYQQALSTLIKSGA